MNLTIEEIIQYFNSSSSSSNFNNSFLDTLEQDYLFNSLNQLLNNSSSSSLLLYLSCLFKGSQHNSLLSSKRLLYLFLFSISIINENQLNNSNSHNFNNSNNNNYNSNNNNNSKVQLLEILFEYMRLLTKEQAQCCADKILSNLSQYIENNNLDISSTLELLPQLVTIGGEKCRDYAIERLCGIDWPSHVIVSCASALVELNSLHTQDVEVITKISSYLHLNNTNSTNPLPLEDFPSLIYQLTTIASNTAPNNTRLLVLDAVADSLDKIADSNLRNSTLNSFVKNNNNNSKNGNGSVRNLTNQVTSTITHHLSLLISKDQAISNEIIKCVRNRRIFKFKSNQTLKSLSPSRLLLCLLAAKSPRNSTAIYTSIVETIQEICQAGALIEKESDLTFHLWFDDAIFSSVEIKPNHLKSLFSNILEGPFMSTDIGSPLLTIALTLMEKKSSSSTTLSSTIKKNSWFNSSNLSSWSNLSSSTLSISSPSLFPSLGSLLSENISQQQQQQNNNNTCFEIITSQSLGAWIVLKLFTECSHIRSQIIREISLHLQQYCGSNDNYNSYSNVSGNNNIGGHGITSSDHTEFQSLQDKLIILIFEALIRTCIDGLMEVTTELQEIFISLSFYHPHTASDLIRIMYPLFSVSPQLADRCTLALRKASFSKDIFNRQTAVCALSTLLRCQLEYTLSKNTDLLSSFSFTQQEFIRPSNHQKLSNDNKDDDDDDNEVVVLSQSENLSQKLSIGISVSEVFSLCRRFFQHQSSVKAALYLSLATLYKDFTHFRTLILQLFRQQILHICITEDDNVYSHLNEVDFLFGDEARCSFSLNIDRCVDSIGNSIENVPDLLLLLTSFSKLEEEQQNQENQDDYHQQEYISHQRLLDICDTKKMIWRLCRGLAFIDLSQYNISQDITTLVEYGRIIVLIESLQAALVCVWTIPSKISDEIKITMKHRLELFKALILRLDNFTEKVIKYKKRFKEKEKDNFESLEGGVGSNLSSPRLSQDSFHRIGRIVLGCKVCCTDTIELEAEFLSKCLDLLNPEVENNELDEDEIEIRQLILDLSCIESFRRHIRERYIRILEVVLQYTEDLSIEISSFSIDNFLPNNYQHQILTTTTTPTTTTKSITPIISSLSSSLITNATLTNQRISKLPTQKILNFRSKIRNLYSPILRDLMLMRTIERDSNGKSSSNVVLSSLIFSGSSLNNQISCKQLSLRGMLGCIRFEILIGQMLSRTFSEREESLSEMLEFGSNSNNNSSSSSTTTPSYRSLEYFFKKFVTLFLALQESGKGEAPIVVLILGELAGLISSETKQHLSEYLMKQCNEKLYRPTTSLSQSLVQLFIIRLAQNSTSRFASVIKMADLIQNCCKNATEKLGLNEENEDEENEGDERRNKNKNKTGEDNVAEETFTFISFKTVAGTTTTLVSILEKVCSIMLTLIKLESKSNIIVNQTSSLNSEDNDSIMDEGDDETDNISEKLNPQHNYYQQNNNHNNNQFQNSCNLHICYALKESMAASVKLLEIQSSTSCSIAVISLLNKLYKIQVALTKDIFLSISKKSISSSIVLSPSFREMSQHTADIITPAIQNSLAQIHNAMDLGQEGNGKKKTRNKLSKLIPDLIYQMENLDVILIKLLGVLKDKEKIIVGKWIKRSTSRDFRLKIELIEVEREKAREKEEKLNRKRNLETKKSTPSSSSSSTTTNSTTKEKKPKISK